MIGELDSEVMNHAALVLCIQVPMFDISDAIHMARKAACRNGAQADLVFGAADVSAAPCASSASGLATIISYRRAEALGSTGLRAGGDPQGRQRGNANL
jgi:hypothetical protein